VVTGIDRPALGGPTAQVQKWLLTLNVPKTTLGARIVRIWNEVRLEKGTFAEIKDSGEVGSD
jgi:heterodisulfide reductase subunit A-like polyferredoxin